MIHAHYIHIVLCDLCLDGYAEKITTAPADREADEEANEETFCISEYISPHQPQVDYLWFIRG